MLIVDKMLVSGIRFVLDKVVQAVETELDDETVHRERLLQAQMELELGQLSDEEFAAIERDVLDRLREIRARRNEQSGGEAQAAQIASGDYKVTGIEASFAGDEHAGEAAAGDEPFTVEPVAPEPPKPRRKRK